MITKKSELSDPGALLGQLPGELRSHQLSGMPDVRTIPGATVVWIRHDPVEMSKAQQDGFHLPRRGDGFILNEDLLQADDHGYLIYGDAIPAVVRQDALAAATARVLSKFRNTLHKPESPHTEAGQLVMSEKRVQEIGQQTGGE